MVLNKAVEKSGKKSFANVCNYYFGRKWARAFIFMLIVFNFMVCVLYPTIAWNFIEVLIQNFIEFPVQDPQMGTFDEYAEETWKWRTYILLGLGLLMLPINLGKNFGALRYCSSLVILTILFTIGVRIMFNVFGNFLFLG